MKLLEKIEKTKDCWFLIAIIFIFFLLRLPSLFEPLWYGDEGIYQVIGIALSDGRLLYQDIWDNKPPLLYILYGIFSSDQFTLRLVSLFFGIFATLSFWALAKKLFEKKELAVFFSTGLFALLFATPVLEGNIANAENFMLFPIILSGFFIYKAATEKNDKKIFLFQRQLSIVNCQLLLSGFLLSLAFLFKIVAIFDLATFTLFMVYVIKNRQKQLLFFFAAFALPLLAVVLFFLFKGAFTPFIEATLQQNVGYVGYGNRFFIPQGLLLTKLMLLFLAGGLLFIWRHTIPSSHLFILLWFFFSLFNAFFSGRPYTHYLLVLLPSFSLMFGLLFLKDTSYPVKKPLVYVLITVTLIAIHFNLYTKVLWYYQNFISFIINNKSVVDYQSFFDKNTPVDYAIASFLNMRMKETDTVFIWGNNGQVYALINRLPPGRFIVAYHITSTLATIEETERILAEKKPTYIVHSLKQPIPFPLTNYKERIMIYNTHIYERKF